MMKKICTNGNLNNLSLFSAEAVGNNEDLKREIFLCLPVRSLLRFKLVSKQWYSLISDPQFARDRTCRLNPDSIVPSGLFFYNSLTKSQEIEYVSLHDSPIRLSSVRGPSLSFLDTAAGGAKITILQSCNGLLFCLFTLELRKEYCVCNPTTKNYKIIPQLSLPPWEKASGFTLAFNPSVSPHYKIVCLKMVSYQGSQIKIYSSETGKWSTSTCRSDGYYNTLKSSGFYWNGSIYWINEKDVFEVRNRCYIYDLEMVSFEGFDMPQEPLNNFDQPLRYMGESQGRLHLVYIQSRSANTFQVLERDRETLKWSVKYRVHICHLLSKFPEICVKPMNDYKEYAFSILSFYKGEKEEDTALVLTIQGKVVSYNLHSKKVKILSKLQSHEVIHTSRYHYCTAFNFIETLASV